RRRRFRAETSRSGATAASQMISNFFTSLVSMLLNTLRTQQVATPHFLAVFPVLPQPLISILLSIAPIIAIFAGLFALTTWLERKGLGRIQNRLGGQPVGPFLVFLPL